MSEKEESKKQNKKKVKLLYDYDIDSMTDEEKIKKVSEASLFFIREIEYWRNFAAYLLNQTESIERIEQNQKKLLSKMQSLKELLNQNANTEYKRKLPNEDNCDDCWW